MNAARIGLTLTLLPALIVVASPAEPKSDAAVIERVFARSHDGVFVPGAVLKPAGPGPFPAILYIHGGVGGSGHRGAENMLRGRVPEHFHKLGYVSLATDYRKYHFGEDEIQDVLAAYRYLAALPYVDKSRIAVIGGSHGGYLAQMLATRVEPAATVSFAGLTDIEGMFYESGLELAKGFETLAAWREELRTHRERAKNRPRPATPAKRVPGGNSALRPGTAGYEVALDLGWRYGERREVFRAISPKENVDKVKGPVLYLVGGKDRLRFAGKAWIEALQERGVVARYSEHADMPHGFYWGRGEKPPRQFHEALKVTSAFIEGSLGKR